MKTWEILAGFGRITEPLTVTAWKKLQCWWFETSTLPKTNMDTQNDGLEKVHSLKLT